LLLHYPPLFRLIDEWVSALSWEEFEEVVAQLRRTFSGFSRYDRQRLMDLVRSSVAEEPPVKESTQDTVATDPLLTGLLSWIA
jgi:hypothetical protein